MRSDVWIGVAWVAVGALAMTGCSSTPPAAHVPSAVEAPPDAEPTPSPVAPEHELLTFDVTTEEGYTAKVTLVMPEVSFAEQIALAPPGFTDMVSPISIPAEMTNTTPGRSWEVFPQYQVLAAYPASASVCQIKDRLEDPNMFMLHAFESHCYMLLGLLATNTTLSPDQTVELPQGSTGSAARNPSFTGTEVALRGVPEAEAATVLTELNNPLGIALATTGDSATIGQPALCTWEIPFNTLSIFLASAPAACP